MPCDRTSGTKGVVTGGALPTTRRQSYRPYTGARPSLTDRAADQTTADHGGPLLPLPALWLLICVAGMSVVVSYAVAMYCIVL